MPHGSCLLCYNMPMFEQIAWVTLIVAIVVGGVLWLFISRPQAWRRLDKLARGFLFAIAAVCGLAALVAGGWLGAVLGGLPGFILGGVAGLCIIGLIVMTYLAHVGN